MKKEKYGIVINGNIQLHIIGIVVKIKYESSKYYHFYKENPFKKIFGGDGFGAIQKKAVRLIDKENYDFLKKRNVVIINWIKSMDKPRL